MTETAPERIYHQAEQLECTACHGAGEGCKYCRGTGSRARRMDGYYIGFDPTGNHAVDKILGAVACAGKAYHHTDSWGDETPPHDDHEGSTPVEWIQNAANQAATAQQETIAALVEALEAAEEHLVSLGFDGAASGIYAALARAKE